MCCATSTFPLIGLFAARHYVTLSNNTSYYILIQLNCINFTVYIIVLTTANRPNRVDENCRSLWLITLLFCSVYIYTYKNGDKRCRLCLAEKYHVIFQPFKKLNKRSEIISKCRHENKFYLKNFKG